ncbi:MAG: type VII secretion protein EccB, partial [Sciscionella sp.]
PAQNLGVCADFRGGSDTPTLSTPAGLVGNAQTGTITESASSEHGFADSVQLKPGSAAVAQSSDGSSTVFVIADPGHKYAAASVGTLAGFGYGSVKPVSLPPQFLHLIPSGKALDATAARRPVAP